MFYVRKYIQFNDLVFDGYSMLSDADASNVSFSVSMKDYTFRNGSYAPLKKRVPRIEASSVSMTIHLEMKKIACDLQDFYRKFVVEELSKAGRLWAVQNKELVWAWAIPNSYSEQNNLIKRQLEIDVEFDLPEGIWHKADKQKTFLVDFDVCEFLRCKKYQKINPCDNCCTVCPPVESKLCCCCNDVCADTALCNREDLLEQVYANCSHGFRVIYDCEAAERIFLNDSTPYLGYSLCRHSLCENLISGQLYSDTDIPTDNFKILFHGVTNNARITINGNTNVIEGEHTDLIIDGSGTLYDSNGLVEDISGWTVPDGNVYGWEIQPGYNSIVVDPGFYKTVTVIEDPTKGEGYAGRSEITINGGEGATTHNYWVKASQQGEQLTSHALCINASYFGPIGQGMPTERLTSNTNVNLIMKAASIRLFYPDMIKTMPDFWYSENISEDTLWCRCHVLASYAYSGDIGGNNGIPAFDQQIFNEKVKPLVTLIPQWYNNNTNGFKDVLDKFDLYIADGKGLEREGYPLQSLSWVVYNNGTDPHSHTETEINCCTGLRCVYFQIDSITI